MNENLKYGSFINWILHKMLFFGEKAI